MGRPARVTWSEGMALDPHHFQQWDRYHLALLHARIRSVAPHAWGLTELQVDEEAIANARAAFMDWMETYREEGREIPEPGGMSKPAKLVLRLPRTLHHQVSVTASREGVSTNTLIATYVAKGIVGVCDQPCRR